MENQEERNQLTKEEIARLNETLNIKSKVFNALDALLEDRRTKDKGIINTVKNSFLHTVNDIAKKAGELLEIYTHNEEGYATCMNGRFTDLRKAESSLMDELLVFVATLENLGLTDVEKRANVLLEVYPEKYTSVEDLKNRLNELRELNVIYANKSIKASGRMLQETWDNFNPLLDDKEYYAMGTLSLAIRSNKKLSDVNRYHDNLDVMVNEDYIEKLVNQIKGNRRYRISSNLNHKEEFAPTFIVTDKNGSTINLYLYDRSPENETITYLSYYRDGGKLSCHYEEVNESLSSYAFNDDEHTLSNNYVYALKRRRNLPKDRFDMRAMEKMHLVYDNRVHSMIADIHDSIVGHTDANSAVIERIDRELNAGKNRNR